MLYSFVRPVWRRQVRVRRACVHGRRRRVALDIVSVIHAEVQRLCAAGARPRRIHARVGCRLEARVRVLWARGGKKVSVMSLIMCLVLTARLSCWTPSRVRCGVGRCECVEWMVYEQRRRVVHGVISVVRGEGWRLCTGAGSRRDRW